MAISLFELFQRGGPVMWPILLCSMGALAIVIERVLTLSRLSEDFPRLVQAVTGAIENRQLAQAQRACHDSLGPWRRMVQAGIQRYGRPKTEIKEAMEEAWAGEAQTLERYVPILGTIAHVTPLLGLLGTVTGLIRCFQTIQEKATSVNPVNPADLAGGIWEALLTTVFGLLVAIPSYTMYHILVHRTHEFVNQLEASCSRLVSLLAGQGPHIPAEEVRVPET